MEGVIAIYLPEELKRMIEEIAKREFTSKSAVIRRFLVAGLRAEGYFKEGGEDDG